MTIKLRERLYWLFFFLSAAGMLALGLSVLWVGPSAVERVRLSFFQGGSPVAFYTAASVAVVCAFLGTALTAFVARSSGKTVSVEIFFFSLWALCQSLELARGFMLIVAAHGAGANFFAAVTRAALFGRYLGSLALFAGSLFSVGLKQERSMPVLSGIVLAALLFATLQPLNSVGPGATILLDRGLAMLAVVFELAVLGLAFADYLVAWRSSRDKAYLHAGLGMLGVAGAALVLKSTTSPWIALASLPVLVASAAAHTRSLHDYYLWR